jgi:hypothetical protein
MGSFATFNPEEKGESFCVGGYTAVEKTSGVGFCWW